jgi:hypothetical protein
MTTLRFTHEFALRYEMAATARTAPMIFTSFGRNTQIDLILAQTFRDEHVLWTSELWTNNQRIFCLAEHAITRQLVSVSRPDDVLYCVLTVSLIADNLPDFPRPDVLGPPSLSGYIQTRKREKNPVTTIMSDSTFFYRDLTEHGSFVLGASERLSKAQRYARISDQTKHAIQYSGTIRPTLGLD